MRIQTSDVIQSDGRHEKKSMTRSCSLNWELRVVTWELFIDSTNVCVYAFISLR